jgi:hypothetical protein
MITSRSTVTVRYAETDMMGVVYHGNYLPWFEVGRTTLLKEQGLSPTAARGRGFSPARPGSGREIPATRRSTTMRSRSSPPCAKNPCCASGSNTSAPRRRAAGHRFHAARLHRPRGQTVRGRPRQFHRTHAGAFRQVAAYSASTLASVSRAFASASSVSAAAASRNTAHTACARTTGSSCGRQPRPSGGSSPASRSCPPRCRRCAAGPTASAA